MDVYYTPGDSDEEYEEIKEKAQQDNFYESVADNKETPTVESGSSTIKISKKCLIITVLSIFFSFVLIVGTSVTLSYQMGKKRAYVNVTGPKERCGGDGWFNISSDCFKFAGNACEYGCTWNHSVQHC